MRHHSIMARSPKITTFLQFLIIVVLVVVSTSKGVKNDDKMGIDLLEAEKSAFDRGGFYKEDMARYVTFYLYTHLNQDSGQILRINDAKSIRKSNFDSSHPTRFLAHGWLANYNSTFNVLLREAYFSIDRFNIIVIDFDAIASLPYAWGAIKAQAVGAYVARFVDFMVDSNYIENMDNVHFIGHSIGAHVLGFAGRNCRNGRISVLHALDPTGPYFDYGNESTRLNKGDARYVQVITTNAYTFGYAYPIGHVTFYPAYGKMQPACGIDMFCSHGISIYYFAEGIRKRESFVGTQCYDAMDLLQKDYCKSTGVKAYMTDQVLSKRYHGVYYVPVRAYSPYGYGQKYDDEPESLLTF